MNPSFPISGFSEYAESLTACLHQQDWQPVGILASELAKAWCDGRRVFICGNGGSAANALHWANDFLYAVAKSGGKGIRISALPSNSSTITCLANDLGYDEIFSTQLVTKASEGDVLIALSGSGNSPNIIRALETARQIKMITFALLGYTGGVCKELADVVIHFAVHDMQLAEDLQLIVGHMILQMLQKARASGKI